MAQGFPIEAEIIAYSGQAFTNGTPYVRWSAGGAWNKVAMIPTSGNLYIAHIPSQPEDTDIKYYIHAEDGSGRSENHPYIGELGAHSFAINTLGINKTALIAEKGGVIEFYLNAGSEKAGRNYIILGSMSGTSPGTSLPGDLVLPLNWDAFTNVTLKLANSSFMKNFNGQLDERGDRCFLIFF